eukprot:366538-Chlamydomonas_euryale.AAC.6
MDGLRRWCLCTGVAAVEIRDWLNACAGDGSIACAAGLAKCVCRVVQGGFGCAGKRSTARCTQSPGAKASRSLQMRIGPGMGAPWAACPVTASAGATGNVDLQKWPCA